MSRKSRPSGFLNQNSAKNTQESHKSSSSSQGGSGGGGRVRASLYGTHAVVAAILNPAREIYAIHVAGSEMAGHIASVIEEARKAGLTRPNLLPISKETLDKALPRDAVHQGVALDCKPLDDIDLSDILRELPEGAPATFVMLDQVTDPHNIGAILRSACVFGARGMILQSKHAPDLNGLIAKTACGGAEHVPILFETNLSRALDTLKKHGFFAVGLDERGRDSLDKGPRYDRTVLVLGAEGPGLRPLVRDSCDILMRLPTSGPISSLNVSNAAAVSLFALTLKP